MPYEDLRASEPHFSSATSLMRSNAPQVLRFKFMPTPSKPLHLGHAWLIFLMQAWMRTLRKQGFQTEFVLMFDVRTNDVFERSRALSDQVIQEILRDFDLMDIRPDRIIRNELPSGAEAEVEQLAGLPCFSDWKRRYDFFADHFLHISALDRMLGITHIVRGIDRLPYDSAYRECYQRLSFPVPQLVYVPVLLGETGQRISFDYPEYLIANLSKRYSRSELEEILLDACLGQRGDWNELNSPDSFFAKLNPSPRIVLA